MRFHDWRPRLHKAMAKFDRTPFVWGENDCTHFAAACVEAMTGNNPRARLNVPAYTDKDSAFKTLQAWAEDLPMLLMTMYEPVHPARAQDGDIAIVDGRLFWHGLGIFERDIVHVLTMNGRGTVSREIALEGFRIT